jgi:hypothetical protein
VKSKMSKLLAVAVAGALALGGATAAVADHRPGHPANPGKAKGKSKVRIQQAQKVTLCHRTGSTTNPTRTISVSERAQDAHMNHGDTAGACQNGQPRGATRLTADLTAVAGATGEGEAVVDVRLLKKHALVCYTLDVEGFTATAAHIHTFAAQTIGGTSFPAGEIVVPLKTPGANGVARGCTKVSLAIGEAILASPASFFVNVHSVAFPAGHVEGALAGA